MVISPLIRKGTVDHTLYDHASVPATLESLFSLDPMTRRDAEANDVLHLLALPVARATPRQLAEQPPPPLLDCYNLTPRPPFLPVHPTFWASLNVRAIRWLDVTPPDQQEYILQRWREISSDEDAMRFAQDAEEAVISAEKPV